MGRNAIPSAAIAGVRRNAEWIRQKLYRADAKTKVPSEVPLRFVVLFRSVSQWLTIGPESIPLLGTCSWSAFRFWGLHRGQGV
jgi:hypothetical protein